MQLMNVSGRLCAKDTHLNPQTVKDLLMQLPPNVYIAISRTNSVLEGLEVIIETPIIQILRLAQAKEATLPKIPKEVKLPTLEPRFTVREALDKPCSKAPIKAVSKRRQLKLPTIQLPNLSNLLPFKSKTAAH